MLVALIAALVLVRLYPLPLRLALRSVARLRGAIGFLALARAGRSSAAGTLPLLALLVALTTAAFGGSVLAGVAAARDTAAVLATGADARISGEADSAPLPDSLVRTVSGADGVREVAPVQIEYGVSLPPPEHGFEDAQGTTLIGVDPVSYARLARSTGVGSFTASGLSTPARRRRRARCPPRTGCCRSSPRRPSPSGSGTGRAISSRWPGTSRSGWRAR